jgi:hypothetical protein
LGGCSLAEGRVIIMNYGKAESRKQKAESRKQKAEGRRQKA